MSNAWESMAMIVISCPPAFWSLQLWVEERLPLAQSADYGKNLQTVQLFMKKNQVSPALPCQSHLSPPCPALPCPSERGPAWPPEGQLQQIIVLVGSGGVPRPHSKNNFDDGRENSGRTTECAGKGIV